MGLFSDLSTRKDIIAPAPSTAKKRALICLIYNHLAYFQLKISEQMRENGHIETVLFKQRFNTLEVLRQLRKPITVDVRFLKNCSFLLTIFANKVLIFVNGLQILSKNQRWSPFWYRIAVASL